MNIAGMGAVYSAMYQNTVKVQNTETNKTSFSQQLQNVLLRDLFLSQLE